MLKIFCIIFLLDSLVVCGICQEEDFDRKVLENPNLFQGDIVPNKKLLARNQGNGVTTFLSVQDKSLIWKDKTVYLFNDMPKVWQESNNHLLNSAIREIEKKTCIRFKKQTKRNGWIDRIVKKGNDYVRLFNGTGCWSIIGRTGGEQDLSLGLGCNFKGIIVHELMHAIGFFHKHSQPDREQHLNIHWNNIMPNMKKEFNIVDGRIFVKGFDFMSIMLYGPDSFSKKPGLITMTRKDGGRLMQVWHKRGLTQQDAFSVNTLYDCKV
jgi:hypothetical protein